MREKTVATTNSKRISYYLQFARDVKVDLTTSPLYEISKKAYLGGGNAECEHVLKLDNKTYYMQLNFDNATRYRKFIQICHSELKKKNDLPLFGTDNNGEQMHLNSLKIKTVGGTDSAKLYKVDGKAMSKKEIADKMSAEIAKNCSKYYGLDQKNYSYSCVLDDGESILAFVDPADANKAWGTMAFDEWAASTASEIGVSKNWVDQDPDVIAKLEASSSRMREADTSVAASTPAFDVDVTRRTTVIDVEDVNIPEVDVMDISTGSILEPTVTQLY